MNFPTHGATQLLCAFCGMLHSSVYLSVFVLNPAVGCHYFCQMMAAFQSSEIQNGTVFGQSGKFMLLGDQKHLTVVAVLQWKSLLKIL